MFKMIRKKVMNYVGLIQARISKRLLRQALQEHIDEGECPTISLEDLLAKKLTD